MMKTIMNIKNLNTIEAIDEFLQGNQAVAFSVLGDNKGALPVRPKHSYQVSLYDAL